MSIDARVSAAAAAAAAVDPPSRRAGDRGGCVLGAPVLAVLVARDGAAFLPRALDALAAQTRQPDSVVAVDLGSRDDSPHLLEPAFPVVLALPRSASFGDAVHAAVAAQYAGALDGTRLPRAADEADEAAGAADEAAGAADEAAGAADEAAGAADEAAGAADEADEAAGDHAGWLWLLHDDCAPRPDALERLLAAVETAPSVAIAGCKQIDWDDDQRILDVGLTVTRSGARVSMVDRHEVDQGQHDERSDVLAVSTSGMLVRRDLWQALGGPDPALAHARDDLDLGRRAHLAGHRVVVVPDAVVAHAAAWATGRRPGAGSWWRAERRDALQLRVAGSMALLVPLVLVWALIAMWPRACLQLLLRDPQRALDELVVPLELWARPDRWIRSRRRGARGRRVPRRTVGRLYAGPLQWLRRRRDEAAAWIVPVEAGRQASSGRPLPRDIAENGVDAFQIFEPLGLDPTALVPVEAGPVPDEAESFGPVPVSARGRRIWFALGALMPVLTLTSAAGITALHRLVGGHGSIVGADLLPTPPTAAVLWRTVTSSWRPSGLGGPAVGDPLAAVLAVGSLAFGGVPGRLVDLLLLGGLPLAAFSAWLAAGAVTRSRLVRGWAALVWAACPPLLAAISTGRVGAVLAHLVLPVAALLLTRAAGLYPATTLGDSQPSAPVRGHRLAAGCAAGLALTLVLAGAPSLTLASGVAVLVLAGLALVLAIRDGSSGRRATVFSLTGVLTGVLPALAVPVGLLMPWWSSVTASPRLLFADAGVPGTSTAVPRPLWHLLLLPGDPNGSPGTLADAAIELVRVFPAAASWPPAEIALASAALFAVPVVLLGLLGLLHRASAALAGPALVVAGAGLATALVASRVTVGAGGVGLDVGAPLLGRPGPGLSLFALGLLAAAVALAHRGRRSSPVRHGPGLRRLAAAARGVIVTMAALVAFVGPLAALAGWAWQGAADKEHRAARSAPALRRVPAEVLPALAADEAQGESASRTLVLRASRSEVRWALAREAGPRLGDDSAALAALRLAEQSGRPGGVSGVSGAGATFRHETELVAPALAALLGDGGEDARDRLAELGVGSVLVVPPVSADVELALDASPGLARVTVVNQAVLWRVELPALIGAPTKAVRARLVDSDGRTLTALPSAGVRVDVQLPAGGSPRYLVLTERADAGWRATLDGRPLPSLVTSGWAQCFELPANGGRLRLDHIGPGDALGGLQAGVLAFALLGLLPLPRLRRRLAVPSPPDPSRPVPRAAIAGPDDLPPVPQVFGVDHPETGEVEPLFSDDPVFSADPVLSDDPVSEAAVEDESSPNGSQA